MNTYKLLVSLSGRLTTVTRTGASPDICGLNLGSEYPGETVVVVKVLETISH